MVELGKNPAAERELKIIKAADGKRIALPLEWPTPEGWQPTGEIGTYDQCLAMMQFPETRKNRPQNISYL